MSWIKRTPEEILSRMRGVHELDKFGGYISSQKIKLREETGILVVDDADSEVIKNVLWKYNFKNVQAYSVRPADEQVTRYPIVITDVCGIGKDLNSNGLQFAEHIKEVFPLKQVIVISGQMQSREYKQDAEIIKKLDGVFKKSSSYDELAKILDPCVCRVNDPAYVWRKIREELLSSKGDLKKDTQIATVAMWEDQFVRQFLQFGRDDSGDAVRKDWIEAMVQGVGLAAKVVELLQGIKAILPSE